MKTRNILLAIAALIFSLGIESASAQLWRLSDYSTNSWSSVASSADGARVDSSRQCDKSEAAARQTFLFRRKPLLPVA